MVVLLFTIMDGLVQSHGNDNGAGKSSGSDRCAQVQLPCNSLARSVRISYWTLEQSALSDGMKVSRCMLVSIIVSVVCHKQCQQGRTRMPAMLETQP